MPDRISYVRAAIEAETASRAAEAQADRMRDLGCPGAALAFAAMARTEAGKAMLMRARAQATTERSTEWRGHRLARWRGEAVAVG